MARVGNAIDLYRVGELNAFDVDQVLFQYSRAAKELRKFCNLASVDLAAAMIRDDSTTTGGRSAHRSGDDLSGSAAHDTWRGLVRLHPLEPSRGTGAA